MIHDGPSWLTRTLAIGFEQLRLTLPAVEAVQARPERAQGAAITAFSAFTSTGFTRCALNPAAADRSLSSR